jgi:hypothetical protein
MKNPEKRNSKENLKEKKKEEEVKKEKKEEEKAEKKVEKVEKKEGKVEKEIEKAEEEAKESEIEEIVIETPPRIVRPAITRREPAIERPNARLEERVPFGPMEEKKKEEKVTYVEFKPVYEAGEKRGEERKYETFLPSREEKKEERERRGMPFERERTIEEAKRVEMADTYTAKEESIEKIYQRKKIEVV